MISINNNSHWINQQSLTNPKAVFILCEECSLTFSQAMQYTENLAVAISKHIHSNDYVALMADNSPEFILTVLSLWKIKAVPVLIDPRLSEQEKHEAAKSAGCRHKIIIRNKDILVNNILVSFETKILNHHASCVFDRNSEALIVFTSGSSGGPKGVVHTFESLFQSVLLTDNFIKHSSRDKWLASLPFFHIGGFAIFIRALICGTTIIIPSSLAVQSIANSLVKYKPTLISLVFTTLKRLAEIVQSMPDYVRMAFVGGGPSDNSVLLQLINSGWPLVKVYGSSETAAMIAALSPMEFNKHSKSSGKIFPGVQIKINQETNDDKEGVILINSPTLFKKYSNTQHEYFTEDGYFESGDKGYLDENNYLFITGRSKDIIISGGKKIFIPEVKNSLMQLNEIKEAIVFAVKDKDWGESVYAAVEVIASHSITESDILSSLKKKLSYYKIPKRVFIMETLPFTATGKPDVQKLIRMFS